MATVNNTSMALTEDQLNDLDNWILDYLDEHEWATPNLLRQEYNDTHTEITRQWVSARVTRLAEHNHLQKVHENADEYQLVNDPRDGSD